MGGLASMTKPVYTLIRSRFQPFTKWHAAAIEYHIKNGDNVGLCIIREYETVSLYHRATPNIAAKDLRHLPIFNPMTGWELNLHILTSLKKAGISILSIPIVSSPLKFSDLITALHGNILLPVKDCDDHKSEKCVLNNVIPIVSRDNMPISANFNWAFPKFDKEDHTDAVNNNVLSFYKHTRLTGSSPSHVFECGGAKLTLGLYGIHILWIYLYFARALSAHDIGKTYQIMGPSLLSDTAWLTTEIDKLEIKIKSYSLDDIGKYIDIVSNFITALLNKFTSVPPEETKLLLNFNEFCTMCTSSLSLYQAN